jgi:hypothetical protein
MGPRLKIVRAIDEPAERRTHAEEWKVRTRHQLGANRIVLTSSGEVHVRGVAAERALEELTLLVQVAAERIGHQIADPPDGRERIASPVQLNETSGLLHWKRAQQDLVDQRKEGRVRADAQREREHGGGREDGAAQKRPSCTQDIAAEVVEPAPHPCLANLLTHLRDAPELERHSSARLGLAQAGPLEVFDAPVHVVAELPIEVRFHSAPSPREQIEESSHDVISPR